MLPLGELPQSLEQIGRFRLLAFDHSTVPLRALVDAHLQCADHFQLGELVDKRRLGWLARRRLLTRPRTILLQILSRLLQCSDQFLQRGDDLGFHTLRDRSDLCRVPCRPPSGQRLRALPDGTLGLIDFGAVGRLDPIQQAAIVELMLALARRDVGLLRDAVERIADLADTTSPEQLERSLARLMAEHVRPGGTVDPAVLQDLVATLSRFGMRLPTDVVLLSRALVTVDGTLRGLRRHLARRRGDRAVVDRGAEPVVDRKELARDELLAMVPHLRRLPERVDRILALTGRGELRVRSIVDEDSRRIVRTLANRLLLVFAGTSFLFTSAWLLVAAEDGPPVSGSTGLFEVFGYGGLLLGVVLVLRVVAAVARDGTT